MLIFFHRFNVDCQASTGLYGLAEGAFGTAGGSGDGDVGTCPAAEPLSPTECEGAVSTCWSPGQRDTDCPDNGLCCVSVPIVKQKGGVISANLAVFLCKEHQNW